MATDGHAISRRSLLRGAGLVGLGGLVSGCCSALASGFVGTGPPKNTLSYWNLLGGGDGTRMQAMEQAYQKQHPNIALDAVVLAWGNPYYTKVSLATLGQRPPDVAISHLTRASILAQAGLLEPLNENELAPYGLTGGHFTPTAWNMAHTNGTLYAIPLDTHPLVMYYNTDICKKAGEKGHRSLRRRRQHQQRHGDPVAVLLLALLPARWQCPRRGRAEDRARRGEGGKGPFAHPESR